MSNNDSRNGSPPQADMPRPRRASVTSAAFNNLFQRSNSTSQGTNVLPGPITTAAMNDQRRRLSISTLGLSGTSPTNQTSAGMRRGSMSTNSDSIDETAIEEDDSAAVNTRTAPTTPFARRMSFGAQAMRSMRAGGATSPGTAHGRPLANPPPPPSHPTHPARRASSVRGPGAASSASTSRRSQTATSQASSATNPRSASDMFSPARTDQGFNWSEQLRSRAESSVSGSRPSFSFASGMNASPPRAGQAGFPVHHDRAKSVSDMPAPPAQAAAMKPRQEPRPKPDHFQERILKGDFYMD